MNLLLVLLPIALCYHPLKDLGELDRAIKIYDSMALLVTKGIITPEIRNISS